ncbi:Mitochondrial substrate carrier family protein G OS=Dictyostelium discoideum GN=mcfG PE=2 SV=1 [Rhizoctonia solani AG-1 IB]|uniref:Mitochondrial substrate carrier family protein G n=1 Tax=Thanatephorus cucumeris (strain AG1-IB / isolate 7/3/14) TaxID=1108050 RepID=A0A0B7F3S9_THACB|nr:Mitochondrial substrate carrier family protein G OS=Dictyostelium discoideum GN=mcfG PE=2 SV=1 [Rhizoctonia solani AG-1 IB]
MATRSFSLKEILGPDVGIDLAAGSMGGVAQVIVGQPLDTIKTRAQIAPKGMFTGPMNILTQTMKNEGFLALYKGMASPLLGIAGVNSLLFASYAISKRIVSPFPELSLPEIAAAGAMAGAANSVLASPVEMFKVRMQGQYGGKADKKLSTVFWDMWKDYGFRKGVMRGFWATVAREIPAYAGFYTGYEFAKRQFRSRYGNQVPVWALLASGSCGGICYWLSCYPLDVVKSRVQLASTPPKGLDYIAQELRAIIREGGVIGLFRGLSPSLLRSIPAAASTFAAYELTKDFLTKELGKTNS